MRRIMAALVVALAGLTPVVGMASLQPARSDAAALVAVSGLTITPVLSGLPASTVGVQFTPDGRIYTAVKEGRILMYDGPGDTTPVTTLDINRVVNSNDDRGLLGLAFDPKFTSGRPYMYVLYTYDRDPFGTNTTVPRWNDGCPNPPGASTDGCTASARLDRYTIDATGRAVTSSVVHLLDGADGVLGGWCYQFSSHSIGTVRFGSDGMLYVGSGEGASFNFGDFGQAGGSPGSPTPPNPCNDHADTVPRTGGRGTALVATTSRGGAFRAQAVRGALADEYVSWDGAILRIDPNTGAAAAGNPLIGNGIAGDDRIVAYGMRNPFRFAMRPGTNDMWVGDVGWYTADEIDHFTTGPGQTSVPNFGWPCYEGFNPMATYANLNADICESLYAAPAHASTLGGVPSPLVAPVYAWTRPGASTSLPCTTTSGGEAVIGGTFVTNPQWPAALRGTYVFGDYARGCIMAMPLGSNGQPDPTRVTPLVTDVAPVDIEPGPGGDIYWVDLGSGTLNRLRPVVSNLPPVASFTATPSNGPSPLTVTFDASATTDPNAGDTLRYTWDLDGNGACDNGSGVTITRTYATPGKVDVMLCVTDQAGATNTTTRQIDVGNSAPVITSLTTSADANGWKVGDTITFHGSATDDGGTLPSSAYAWRYIVRHCDTIGGLACHTHEASPLAGGESGSLVAPDHEFYAFLQLTLTVTDAQGLSTSRTVDLTPRISSVTLHTSPDGIPLTVGPRSGTSPFTGQFLEGGAVQMTVPRTATVAGTTFTFAGWQDGAETDVTRTVPAPPGSTSFTAVYQPAAVAQLPPTLPPAGPLPASTRFHSVEPTRLVDTRVPGGPIGTMVPGQTARLQVAGTPAVPAGTTGIVVNLTAVNASGPGYVTAFPCGAVPFVSNVNTADANAVPNALMVPLDSSGGVCFTSSIATDIVVDLDATLTQANGDLFTGVTPVRVVDTRVGTGSPQQRLAAGGTLRVPLDAAGVPAGASGVATNITVTNPDAAGYVTAYPCEQQPPLASNVNFVSGETVSNFALTSLGAQNALCVTASVATDLVIDVSGWLASTGSSPILVTPTRVLDTRVSNARLAAGGVAVVDAGALGAPAGTTAVVANITVVGPDGDGYVTAYPCSSPRPLASNVNLAAGDTRATLATVALGTDHTFCVYADVAADLVIDLQGWMTG